MIKSTLIEYLKQQVKQAKFNFNNHDSYCIEITPDQANLIVKELEKSLSESYILNQNNLHCGYDQNRCVKQSACKYPNCDS